MNGTFGELDAGDQHAVWLRVVDEHTEALSRYARHLTRSRQDAEDLVQDVFLRAFSHLASSQPRNMGGWLNRIALNLVRDRARRDSQVREDLLSDTILDRCLGSAPSAEKRAIDLDTRQILRSALNCLPSQNRVAVLLCDVDQFTYREIAALTGVNRNTVAARIRRGREQLAAQLDASEFGPHLNDSTTGSPTAIHVKENNHECA